MFPGHLPTRPPGVSICKELSLCGTFLAVRGAVLDLRDALVACAASDTLLMRVEIAVTEALNNVVEHALSEMSDTRIRVSVAGTADSLVITIRDIGKPMPGLGLPAGMFPDLSCPAANLPEGGFGWALAHSVADAISYSRCNDVNTLELVLSDPR